MADSVPLMNLPPESAPWGRYITKTIEDMQNQATSNSEKIGASFQALNSSMKLISKQIATIIEVQETLITQQATLAAQQASLSAQQSALSAAVADIATVSANQVTAVTNTASSGGSIGVGAGGTYVNATVATPAGFTRAYAVGITSITIAGAGPAASVQTNIGGSLGFALPIYSESAAGTIATGGTSHAATFTGLVPGQEISAGARMAAVSNVSGAYIINSIAVTFLK